MNRRWYYFALLLLFLQSCALQPTQEPFDLSHTHWSDARAQQLTQWELTGKVAIRAHSNHQSANLQWTQNPNGFKINLSGPFGLGNTYLIHENNQFTLQSGYKTLKAHSAEALMQQELGWSMPISAIVYWIRGISNRNQNAKIVRNAQNFPVRIEQDGWIIRYLSWQRVNQLELPQRIRMQRGDLEITLVITQWMLKNSSI